MLESRRVVLRPVKKADVKKFLEWFNDLEVIQYLTLYLPTTEIGEEKWIENLETIRKGKDVSLVIEVKDRKKRTMIGNCGLHNIDWKNRDAEFGIAIGEKKFWNNGYGTEAAKLMVDYGFEQLNLNRISSAAYGFNERSINMHLKLGFKKEGCVRKAIYKNGRYNDKILLGILKEEWRKQK